MNVIETENNNIVDITIQKKRGRRPKALAIISDEQREQELKEPTEIKKRGRKPTCKVLNKDDLVNIRKEVVDECLIVQLPINKFDIEKLMMSNLNKSSLRVNSSEYFDGIETQDINKNKEHSKQNDVSQDMIPLYLKTDDKKMSLDFEEKKIENELSDVRYNIVDKCSNCDDLQKSIHNLESKYHIYKITNSDKKIHNLSIKLEDFYNGSDLWETEKYAKVCCWWCCHTFDTLPIGLPEKYYDNVFKSIGIYCSFECAISYNLSLNDHKMWDRISLLYHFRNLIFKKMYPNNNSVILDDIIAAPPRNLLEMFGGTMSIETFRKNSTLLKKQYRNIVPPIMSLINQLEESTYNQEQNLIIKPIKNRNFDNKNTELVLKRTKPIQNKSSLMTSMGIKFNE